MNSESLHWQKSTFSGSGVNCVEVASASGEALIRNSKRIADGALAFAPAELAAFVAGCKAGEFDDLT